MDCRGQAIGDDAGFYADSDFDSVSIQDRREEHNHPRLCGIFCGRLRLFVVGVRFDLSWIALDSSRRIPSLTRITKSSLTSMPKSDSVSTTCRGFACRPSRARAFLIARCFLAVMPVPVCQNELAAIENHRKRE